MLIDRTYETGRELTSYTQNSFFIDQLKAFEIWLKYDGETKRPPQQLPVLLQMLLSQVFFFFGIFLGSGIYLSCIQIFRFFDKER